MSDDCVRAADDCLGEVSVDGNNLFLAVIVEPKLQSPDHIEDGPIFMSGDRKRRHLEGFAKGACQTGLTCSGWSLQNDVANPQRRRRSLKRLWSDEKPLGSTLQPLRKIRQGIDVIFRKLSDSFYLVVELSRRYRTLFY